MTEYIAIICITLLAIACILQERSKAKELKTSLKFYISMKERSLESWKALRLSLTKQLNDEENKEYRKEINEQIKDIDEQITVLRAQIKTYEESLSLMRRIIG